MSIRILNQNGIVQPLSPSMVAEFQTQLRRIGEGPSSQAANTVNLWICDQSPEELLDILKRLPDRTTVTAENDRGAAQMSQSRISDLGDGDRVSSSSTAADTTSHQHSPSPPHSPPSPPAPRKSRFPLAMEQLSRRRHYNTAYRQEYGQRGAENYESGEMFRLDSGVIISLWDEHELYKAEMETEKKEKMEKEKGKDKRKEEEEGKGN